MKWPVVPMVLSAPVVAQTFLGGLASQNRTLTPTGNPHYLVANYFVGRGVTVTIMPGVQVIAQGQWDVVIGAPQFGAGTLVARGTEAQPIVFTSSVTQSGSWGGISFESATVAATFDGGGNYQSGSVMERCVVEYGGGTGRAGVSMNAAAPFLAASVVRRNSRGGVAASASGNIRVLSVSAIENTGVGLLLLQTGADVTGGRYIANSGGGIATGSGPSGRLSIRDVELLANGGSGIYFTNVQSQVLVERCTIGGNGAPLQSLNGGGMSVYSDCLTRDCSIHGNVARVGGGIYVQALFTLTNSQVLCNELDNGGGGGGGIDAFGPTNLAGSSVSPITWNVIRGNRGANGSDIRNSMPFNASFSTINAAYVCWGSVAPRANGRIKDFFSDPTLGPVKNEDQPASCTSWDNLRGGARGVAGVPVLTGSGQVASPSNITVSLANAAPNSTVALVVGFAIDYSYLSAYDLALAPGLSSRTFILMLPTNGTGMASLPLSIPSGLPPELKLVFQAVVADPQAANGVLAMSNAILGQR